MKLTTNNIYFAFVVASVFCKGIGLNNSSIIYAVIMIVGLMGVLLGIGSRKYTRREIWISIIMLFSGIMTLLITRQYTFLITCIAAIGIKNTNSDRLIKSICSVRTFGFILTFSLAMLNVIDQEKTEIWRTSRYVTRYGMGYGHPNNLHLTLFIVLTLIYYCNLKSKSDLKKFWVISFFLNVFIYKYSASRTGFLVICIFELLIVSQHLGIMKKLLLRLPMLIFGLLMGLTYLTPALRKIGLLNDISLLNGRVNYTYLYLTKYGYSLFGFNSSLSKTGLLLDNGYLRLLIEAGIIGLLLWGYLNIKLIKRIVKSNDYRMAIIVSCFYVYIFAESFSSNIFMNYVLFWGADEIFNRRTNEVQTNDDRFYRNLQQCKRIS